MVTVAKPKNYNSTDKTFTAIKIGYHLYLLLHYVMQTTMSTSW